MRIVAVILNLGLLAAAIVFVVLAVKAGEVNATGVGWDGPGDLDLLPGPADDSRPAWFAGVAVLCGVGLIVAHLVRPRGTAKRARG